MMDFNRTPRLAAFALLWLRTVEKGGGVLLVLGQLVVRNVVDWDVRTDHAARPILAVAVGRDDVSDPDLSWATVACQPPGQACETGVVTDDPHR